MVQSGVGKVPSSIALAYAGARYPQYGNYYLNLGIAGSFKRDLSIGSIHSIHKMTDSSTGRSYYPDILYQSPWDSESLITVDKPLFSPEYPGATLVDMEGTGFFQSATSFVDSHRVHSLKVVSDYLDGGLCRREDVEAYMKVHSHRILEWLDSIMIEMSKGQAQFLDTSVLLGTISENLQLTHSQSLVLKRYLESYSRYHKQLPNIPRRFLYSEDETRTKSTGKDKLSKILSFLNVY